MTNNEEKITPWLQTGGLYRLTADYGIWMRKTVRSGSDEIHENVWVLRGDILMVTKFKSRSTMCYSSSIMVEWYCGLVATRFKTDAIHVTFRYDQFTTFLEPINFIE